MNENYIIFITEKDKFGEGLPIYHIEKVIKELGRDLEDEQHTIYVNAQIQDESALGKLMSDFQCTEAKKMNYKVLADRVKYFKEDEEGVTTMCRALEEMREEQKIDTLLNSIKNLMKNLGITAEESMKAIGVTEEEKRILLKRL